MKTLEIIRFELAYQLHRPVNYLYFLLMFVIAFLFSRLGIKGITEVSVQVKENAPLIIHQLTSLLSLPMLLVSSAIMGMVVLRDFERNMAPVIFTCPIRRQQYLAGRFIGAFILALAVSSGGLLGAMAGELFSNEPMQAMLAFQPHIYTKAFLLITVPNLLFVSCLYFAGGALSKKTTVVYTQGLMLVLLISFLDEGVIETAQNLRLATLFDFYALQLINLETKYWSAAEINTQSIPLTKHLLFNRLIFLGTGLIMLLFTFTRFSVTAATRNKRKP